MFINALVKFIFMNSEQNSNLHMKYSEIMNVCISKRKSTNFNLERMAKCLGISKVSLWNYENFKTKDFFFLESYAKMFGIELLLFETKFDVIGNLCCRT